MNIRIKTVFVIHYSNISSYREGNTIHIQIQTSFKHHMAKYDRCNKPEDPQSKKLCSEYSTQFNPKRRKEKEIG